MTKSKQELYANLFISLGIIHQLNDNWIARALAPIGLNQSQFNLLNHFSHQPERSQTVSQLAQVMQMNQPGITKVINRLAEFGLIDITKDDHDGRKKWVMINDAGLEKVKNARESFIPKLDACFQDWDEKEMQQMLSKVDKLKTWLDEHRE
ncbi:MarR family winged helix-turn-helix transcriptional regulator [Vibrio sp. VB16]|uniref:MarR family winged helix-turn-helix transcriptional regulator n=1 Tax=Vibrio sp. VB16 TaxID=2785746 RepID=UPI00189FD01C|nr:MarR family winged helix-turn-helix transcriptional regulator [Vibrio sp. VB16]UGA53504.1 MarR family winged helix-turn-helix transcriptional regulator [Vibrio sp. VB16]